MIFLFLIEATIEIIDVEMDKEPEYLTVGKTPLERVHKLLSKLDSIRRSKERGSVVFDLEKDLSHKYVGQVESNAMSSKEFRQNWARLIQRVYEVDPLLCPKCQGTMKIISFIEKIEIIT